MIFPSGQTKAGVLPRNMAKSGFSLHATGRTHPERIFVSGALHFFDPPVYHMVAELPEKPIHLLINRSPLIAGPTKAAVQDNDNLRTARVLHNGRN